MNSVKNFDSLLKKDNIDQVQICYTDYSGRLCGKLIPASKITSISNNGVVFAKANLALVLTIISLIMLHFLQMQEIF